MKLGISSYTYGWAVGTEGNRPARALSAAELLRRAAEFNVRVLQICDNLPEATYEEVSVDEIAALAKRLSVAVELGTRGSTPAHLRRFAALARRLSSPILRVVIDSADDHPDPDEVVRRIASVMPVFEEHGVTLAIENHDRFKVRTLVGIIRDIASPRVGICLDTVNSFGALEGPDVVIEALGPHVVNLHLKDFTVQRLPHMQGFTVEGRPAGQGMLDIPGLLAKLKSFGRDPNAILELWTPPEPTMEQTILKEARWARESIPLLRQWIKD